MFAKIAHRLPGPSAHGALLALAVGIGAVATGAFIGFLVNGPPPRPIAAAPTSEMPAASLPSAVTAVAATPVVEAAPPAAPPPAAEPREATASAPVPVESQLAFAEVREVQHRLRAAGFDPGPPDGSAGPMTATAAQQYQRIRGLAVTGEVDRDLLVRLREDRATTPPPAPPRRSNQTATAQPRPRGGFFEELERLFRR